MTIAQIVSALFDLGFGGAALLLASRLTATVNFHKTLIAGHETRIVRLEQRAA